MGPAMGVAGAILGASGAIVGAFGARQRGRSERGAMRAQIGSLKRQRGQVDEMFGMKLDQHDQQGQSFLSTQTQKFGLSGVSMEGSPLMVQAESEKNIAQDREMIDRERQMTLSGIDDEIGQLNRAKKASRKSQRFGIAGSLLGGGSNIASGLGSAFG